MNVFRKSSKATGSTMAGVVTLPLLLAACVTINVYFPEAAATQAADQVVCEIVGNCGTNNSNGSTAGQNEEPQASRNTAAPWSIAGTQSQQSTPWALLAAVLNATVPTAQAAATIDVDSPASKTIRARMKKRQRQLEAYLNSGAIGYDNQGNVDMRQLSAVPLPKRAIVRKLLAEENADRSALYKEIARVNSHPEWEGDVRQAFAARWIARAKSGWYYQNDDGAWVKK